MVIESVDSKEELRKLLQSSDDELKALQTKELRSLCRVVLRCIENLEEANASLQDSVDKLSK